jgi:hypothetical protein
MNRIPRDRSFSSSGRARASSRTSGASGCARTGRASARGGHTHHAPRPARRKACARWTSPARSTRRRGAAPFPFRRRRQGSQNDPGINRMADEPIGASVTTGDRPCGRRRSTRAGPARARHHVSTNPHRDGHERPPTARPLHEGRPRLTARICEHEDGAEKRLAGDTRPRSANSCAGWRTAPSCRGRDNSGLPIRSEEVIGCHVHSHPSACGTNAGPAPTWRLRHVATQAVTSSTDG